MSRPVTPSPRGPLNMGLFHQASGYDTWRPHGTDDWLIVLTLGGEGRFGYDAGEIRVRAGDLVAVEPGTLHDYGTARDAERWELVWAHVNPRPHWLVWLDWPSAAPGLRRLTPRDARLSLAIQKAFEQACQLWRQSQPGHLAFAFNALERVLLFADRAAGRRDAPPLDPRVRDAMDWIGRRLPQPIALADVAAAVHLSRSRLAHLFREQTQQTPQQYIEHQRLERARQLLELTPMKVYEVAAAVGYDNPFYFTLRFSKRFGASPRAYRERVVRMIEPV